MHVEYSRYTPEDALTESVGVHSEARNPHAGPRRNPQRITQQNTIHRSEQGHRCMYSRALAVQEPERRPTLEKLLEHPSLNSAFAIAVNAATSLGTFGKKILRS